MWLFFVHRQVLTLEQLLAVFAEHFGYRRTKRLIFAPVHIPLYQHVTGDSRRRILFYSRAHFLRRKIVLVDCGQLWGFEDKFVCYTVLLHIVESAKWPVFIALEKLLWVLCCLRDEVLLTTVKHLESTDELLRRHLRIFVQLSLLKLVSFLELCVLIL